MLPTNVTVPCWACVVAVTPSPLPVSLLNTFTAMGVLKDVCTTSGCELRAWGGGGSVAGAGSNKGTDLMGRHNGANGRDACAPCRAVADDDSRRPGGRCAAMDEGDQWVEKLEWKDWGFQFKQWCIGKNRGHELWTCLCRTHNSTGIYLPITCMIGVPIACV